MADIGKAPASPSPEPSEQAEPESTGRVGAVALAWLPAGDYEQAVQLWPELADSDRVRARTGRCRTGNTARRFSRS